jgi:hypothetical protein
LFYYWYVHNMGPWGPDLPSVSTELFHLVHIISF